MFGRYDFPNFWHQILIILWSSRWAKYSLYSSLFAQGKVQKSVFRRKNWDTYFLPNIFVILIFNFVFCFRFTFMRSVIVGFYIPTWAWKLPYAYMPIWPYAYMPIWPYKWPSLKTLKSHNFCLGNTIFLKVYLHTQDVLGYQLSK